MRMLMERTAGLVRGVVMGSALMAGGCWTQGELREDPGEFSAVSIQGTVDVVFDPAQSVPMIVRCLHAFTAAQGEPVRTTDLVQTSVEDRVLTVRALVQSVDNPRGPRGVRTPGLPDCTVLLRAGETLDFVEVNGNGNVVGLRAARIIHRGDGRMINAQLSARPGNQDTRVENTGHGSVELMSVLGDAAVRVRNRHGQVLFHAGSWFVRSLDVEQHGPGRVEFKTGLVVGHTRVDVNGGGTAWLAARGRTLEVHMNGSGKVSAGDLDADTAEVWAEGTGLVRVRAKHSAQVTTRGPVEVEVLGDAAEVSREEFPPWGQDGLGIMAASPP